MSSSVKCAMKCQVSLVASPRAFGNNKRTLPCFSHKACGEVSQ